MRGWTLVALVAGAVAAMLFSAGAVLGAVVAPVAEPFGDWSDFVTIPAVFGLLLLLFAGPLTLMVIACIVAVPRDRRWRWLRLITRCEPLAREAPAASCGAMTIAAVVAVLASADPAIWRDGLPAGFYATVAAFLAVCWVAVWRLQPSMAGWARRTRLRALRSLRSRCLTCGYPRPAPHAPCPECGRPQPKTGRRALHGTDSSGQG